MNFQFRESETFIYFFIYVFIYLFIYLLIYLFEIIFSSCYFRNKFLFEEG